MYWPNMKPGKRRAVYGRRVAEHLKTLGVNPNATGIDTRISRIYGGDYKAPKIAAAEIAEQINAELFENDPGKWREINKVEPRFDDARCPSCRCSHKTMIDAEDSAGRLGYSCGECCEEWEVE